MAMIIDKDLLMMNIGDFLTEIAEKCKELSLAVMASRKGWNDKPKANKNTLIGSDLYNDLEVTTDGESFIDILVNDYIDYIQGGMKPGHWLSDKVTEEHIIPWMVKHNIPTDNKTVRAIQASIYYKGIRPRPIFEISPYGEWTESVDGHNGLVLDLIDGYWESWSDELFGIITEQLDNYFNE